MRHPWVMPLITALLSLGLAQGQPSHTVQKGDTLYSIARKYGTTVERISELNGLSGTSLEVGQTLRLPSAISHTVQKGDTLFSVARKYGSSVEAIQRENKLGMAGLVVGSTLKIPVGIPSQVKAVQPAPVAAKPPKPEAPSAPIPQTPQAVQVVQPKSPGETLVQTGLAVSTLPIPTPKPDLDEPVPTGLPKPPPKGQGVQLVNPQALPMTVVTLPDDPSPTEAITPTKPEAASSPKTEATLAPPIPLKVESTAKIEPSTSTKDEPLGVSSPAKVEPKEDTTPKVEPAPKPEPAPREEMVLPKQPSIPATGDYNPNHPLMPVVLKYLGTPYIFGANSDRAVDCSAFVQQVFGDLGLKVPRTSREQWSFFPATTKLLQGDLVFFSFGGKQIDHVGIYLGRNVFVHANSYESRVVIESLDAPTYKRVYRGGRSTNLGQLLAASASH